MRRILITAAACALLSLCPGARGDECGKCASTAAGRATCGLGVAWWKISDRGPLAQAIDAQRCCSRCATLPCCCPDDYCRKPLPCIPCQPCCGCPDDYCPKPQPCVPCMPRCGCPDDYCPKPAPNLCLPLNRDHLRCGCPSDAAPADTGRKPPG